MVGDMYGAYVKFYEPYSVEAGEQVIEDLKYQASQEIDNIEDYHLEVIEHKTLENGVLPVWTIAVKATRKVTV